MSTALGISAVTAVLENLLNSVYVGAGLGSVDVSAVAPDIVQSSVGTGSTTHLQVNLFLHQVTPNAAWRNEGLPAQGADGRTRLTNPPLALDLHYLLTAYASADCEAEALLGFAVQFMHENPVLARSDIQANLASLPSNPPLAALLGSSGLADQIESIKLTPSVLGREEMAWLWTALKADYRLTFPFQASVVLIQAQRPAQAALPVASRNVSAQAGLLPAITSITQPAGQAAAAVGDTVTVNGNRLDSAVNLRLSSAHLGIQSGPVALTKTESNRVRFVMPDLPVGVYLLSVLVQPAGLSSPVSTNSLPLAVAARITGGLPVNVAGPSFTLNPTCAPAVRSTQQVSLVLGRLEVVADPFSGSTTAPIFNFTGVTAGAYLVRLRVDGIDSPLTYAPPPGGPVIQVT
ncbi:MAG: DUF4255 domain-containing protein [Verrucomicrobia bacterium]|nr:DUF4255 domain-containing protein [Verrucomicrobiota bacterium]